MKKLDIIDHVAVQVKNIKSAVRWYTENFNCLIEYQDTTWAMLKFDNTKLALVLSGEHPPHFAILRDSLDDKAQRHRDGSISVYKKDLDGNPIELIKY